MQTQSRWMKTIAAKSDQLNADDLIACDKIIEITGVYVDETKDQPAVMSYRDDQGKPYKPCKTMRKVIAKLWGGDESQYVGRFLHLYNDSTVKWGGEEVGGIRIKAMSHIDRLHRISLQIAKGRRVPINIEVLKPARTQPQPLDWGAAILAIEQADSEETLKTSYAAAWRYAKSIGDDAKMKEAEGLKDEAKERLSKPTEGGTETDTEPFPEFDESEIIGELSHAE